MSGKATSALVVLILLVLLAFSSMFIVMQGQHALLLRLGSIVTDAKTGQPKVFSPGLHFKYPFVNQVRIFDTRLQTLDIKQSRIVTKEKKDVIVDSYVKWRIENLAQYYKATGGNEFNAETLLGQKLNTALRAEFGKRFIVDVVSGERDDVMDILQDRASESAKGLGIKVVDVRIKGIDLPSNVNNSVYARMRANMQKIANKHQADGKAAAEAIRAQADAKVTVIVANARMKAKKLQAEGQAQAASIYAQAYDKNADFYAFYRSLQAYDQAFKDKSDILVLQPDGQFFKYFNQSIANKRSISSNN